MAGVALRRLARLTVLVALGAPCTRGCDDKGREPAAERPVLAFSSCTICHVDLQEQLAKGAHGPVGVTCASCHGASQGHVSDEHNEVKPDRMFTADAASGLCGECHNEELGKAAGMQAAPGCVACHGAHEILAGRAAKQARKRLGAKKPH